LELSKVDKEQFNNAVTIIKEGVNGVAKSNPNTIKVSEFRNLSID
jgi:hypothetical protein